MIKLKEKEKENKQNRSFYIPDSTFNIIKSIANNNKSYSRNDIIVLAVNKLADDLKVSKIIYDKSNK